MKRYFLVSYSHDTGFGNALTITKNGYINQNQFIKNCKDDSNLNNVIILNIIEMTETDFKDFSE